MIASWTLMAVGLPRGAAARSPLDRVWLDFRDAFGVAWGLRVAERLNASAAMYSWPVTLTWQGFRGRQEGTSDIPPAAVEEGLRGLLRRFVSPEWIDSRLTEFMLADEPRPVMQKRP